MIKEQRSTHRYRHSSRNKNKYFYHPVHYSDYYLYHCCLYYNMIYIERLKFLSSEVLKRTFKMKNKKSINMRSKNLKTFSNAFIREKYKLFKYQIFLLKYFQKFFPAKSLVNRNKNSEIILLWKANFLNKRYYNFIICCGKIKQSNWILLGITHHTKHIDGITNKKKIHMIFIKY